MSNSPQAELREHFPPQNTEATQDRPELSHLAQWSASSHKYGFGVENLRDGNDGTFWQSEGPQPHMIDLSFPKRVHISSIALHMSHPRDDSYTPSRIGVRAGTGVHDLQEARYIEFNKPDGWTFIPLRPEATKDGGEKEGPPIPCYHLRITIFANHLNGKDTHIRGLRVYGAPGPREAPLNQLPSSPTLTDEQEGGLGSGRRLLELGHDGLSGFTSVAFKMHERIR
ncbi:hypothetical protein IAT38_003353 [Cryptococcus sp. DSM 104549]